MFFFFCFKRKYYLCIVQTYTMPSGSLNFRWQMELTVAGEIGRTLHNKKRHRCFVLGRLKPEKFQIVVLEQKSEVNAYGYGMTISRGVQRGCNISSCTLFPGDICIYIGVGINSVSFNSKGNLRASISDEQKWIPAFFVMQFTMKLYINSLIGCLQAW